MHMINNKSTVNMICLDFSKAFDKVGHGILLHKLRDLVITGRLGLVPEQQAALCKNTWGPQGTVIGPLLFLIMIIDIHKGISP